MTHSSKSTNERELRKWKKIIWREWHNCRAEEDPEYKKRLFALVADQPLGWSVVALLVLLGVVYGALAGTLVADVAGDFALSSISDAHMVQLLPKAPMAWGGTIGAVIGLFIGLFMKRTLTTRHWLQAFQCLVGKFRDNSRYSYGRLGFLLICALCLVPVPFFGWVVSSTHVKGDPSAVLLIELMFGGFFGFMTSPNFGLAGSLLITILSGTCGFVVYRTPFALAIIVGGGLGAGLAAGFMTTGYTTVFGLLKLQGSTAFRANLLMFWRPRRPSPLELEEAIRAIGDTEFAEPLHQIEEWRQHMPSVAQLFQRLNTVPTDWISCFAVRHVLAGVGGEAVVELEHQMRSSRRTMRKSEVHLLADISRDTTGRLAHRAPRLLCPHCLVHCVAHKVHVSRWRHIRFYGCRVCKQSREFIEHAGQVVAVLDTGWNEKQNQADSVPRVNWHKRRTIFDFDKVQILQATDEDVERFCVQVANDSDPYRRKRYRKIPVTIASSCTLSENSLRVLRSSFGKVTTRS